MRIVTARIIGLVGLAAYNGWVAAVIGGRLSSSNELLSDLEVVGHPYAAAFSNLDVVAGVLVLVALWLRGRNGPLGIRPEWRWLLAFAVAGIVGGLFPYVCSEGVSAACRTAEWHFQLPRRHYVHVLAGIVEFAAASVAIGLAWRRTAGRRDTVGWIVRGIGVVLMVAYPLIAVAYLTDRLGAFVEPLFFIGFSTMVAVELFEPAPRTEAAHRRS
ncbi:MAG TPA: DUF998 domain-containing protein [Actinomycetes bacterium]